MCSAVSSTDGDGVLIFFLLLLKNRRKTNKFHYKPIYALEPTAVTWLSPKVRYVGLTRSVFPTFIYVNVYS